MLAFWYLSSWQSLKNRMNLSYHSNSMKSFWLKNQVLKQFAHSTLAAPAGVIETCKWFDNHKIFTINGVDFGVWTSKEKSTITPYSLTARNISILYSFVAIYKHHNFINHFHFQYVVSYVFSVFFNFFWKTLKSVNFAVVKLSGIGG